MFGQQKSGFGTSTFGNKDLVFGCMLWCKVA